MSSGQRTNRFSLALVTFLRPRVLLLDEIAIHLIWVQWSRWLSRYVNLKAHWWWLAIMHDVWFLKQVIEGDDGDDDADAVDGEEFCIRSQR